MNKKKAKSDTLTVSGKTKDIVSSRGNKYGKEMSQRKYPDRLADDLTPEQHQELTETGQLIRGGLIFKKDESGKLVQIGRVGGFDKSSGGINSTRGGD
tara:strand:+ start:1665 stop:1958 length:294 start_codon:yes stop_codon:yes gene_type:complete